MRDIFRLAYSVQMKSGTDDTAEMMLYGEIIPDTPEGWKWSKEDKSAADFDKAVKAIKEKGAKKLLLRINSPGGVCTEAVAMRAILANAGFDEINIRIEGLCASAATDIATLPGAHVAITEGSEYMIHNPWTIAMGNADDFEHAIERLRNIEKTSRQFYAAKSGQSDEQIKEWMDAETWFTAEQAVENGFCDELLKAKKEAPIAACVSSREMAVMKSLYHAIPDGIEEKVDDLPPEAEKTAEISVTQPQTYAAGGYITDSSICLIGDNAQEFIGRLPTVASIDTTLSRTLEDAIPAILTNVRHGKPDSGEPSEINSQQEVDTMDIKELTMEELREGNPALIEQIAQEAVNAERERLSDIDALTIPGYEEIAEQAKANGTSVMDFQKQIVAAMKKKGTDFLKARVAETTPAQEITGGEPEREVDQKVEDVAKEIAGYAESYNGTTDGMF